MKAAPFFAIAVSTSTLGWPQQAGPNVPFRKPRWSRKWALIPAAAAAVTISCTGSQYLCNKGIKHEEIKLRRPKSGTDQIKIKISTIVDIIAQNRWQTTEQDWMETPEETPGPKTDGVAQT